MSIDKIFLEKKIKKGMQFLEKEMFSEAIKIFEYLKKNKQTKIIGLLFLGIVQIKKKNNTLAKEIFYNILKIDLNHEDASLNLALVFFDEKNYEKAEYYLNKVISINKNNLTAIYHKALVYFFKKDLESAIKHYKICINLNKNFIYSYLNLGHIYLRTKKFDKALYYYNKVLELDPNHNPSKFNLSWCYFRLLDFDNAFKNYEFRKEKINLSDKAKEAIDKYECVEWIGENLDDKKILIITEQGIGDNIQFFRYLFALKNKFKVKVIFYVNKKIAYLFNSSPFEIVTNLNNVDKIDYYQHLISLPGIFYEDKKEIQKFVPYIKINNNNYLHWKNRLSNFNRPVIGLNWQGDKNYDFDDMRSIPLSLFNNILKIKDYSFISLQKGFGVEQIKLNKLSDYIVDLSNEIDIGDNAFEDTISILKNIDLLITPDTSLCHLGGTLGVKTYLLLNYNPDWRWFIESKHGSFYPSTKIIQQDAPNDWNSVIEKIQFRLEKDFKFK